MTIVAQILKEIETMSEEEAAQVLDFAKSLNHRHIYAKPKNSISIKDAYGIFKDLKGMDTAIERDEDDRI